MIYFFLNAYDIFVLTYFDEYYYYYYYFLNINFVKHFIPKEISNRKDSNILINLHKIISSLIFSQVFYVFKEKRTCSVKSYTP